MQLVANQDAQEVGLLAGSVVYTVRCDEWEWVEVNPGE